MRMKSMDSGRGADGTSAWSMDGGRNPLGASVGVHGRRAQPARGERGRPWTADATRPACTGGTGDPRPGAHGKTRMSMDGGRGAGGWRTSRMDGGFWTGAARKKNRKTHGQPDAPRRTADQGTGATEGETEELADPGALFVRMTWMGSVAANRPSLTRIRSSASKQSGLG